MLSSLADLVLLTHAAFVAFVILGLGMIVTGGIRGWRWIRNPWWRLAHLVAIGVVVAQAWLGLVCPLTTLEMHLRERAGEPTYGGSFIAYWLGEILYHEAPPWVFAIAYTVFGAVVVISWIRYRPRPLRRKPQKKPLIGTNGR